MRIFIFRLGRKGRRKNRRNQRRKRNVLIVRGLAMKRPSATKREMKTKKRKRKDRRNPPKSAIIAEKKAISVETAGPRSRNPGAGLEAAEITPTSTSLATKPTAII